MAWTAAVDQEKGLVLVGEWSKNYLQVMTDSEELLRMVREGHVQEAREDFWSRPVPERAALVLLNTQDQEEMLSLTGRDGPGYDSQVVSLLPSELLTSLVAPKTRYLKYNPKVIESMSPEKLESVIEDILEHVNRAGDRQRICWEWFEALVDVDREKRSELLRGVEVEALAEALVEAVGDFRFKLSMPMFENVDELLKFFDPEQFFTEVEGVGAMPSQHIEDEELGQVLDAVYDAAPEVFQGMVRSILYYAARYDEPGMTEAEE